MKIFTNKQFKELMLKTEREMYEKGVIHGEKSGYKKGFHEGITFERKGVVFTSSGLYNFKDNEATEITTNIKGEMTNENN